MKAIGIKQAQSRRVLAIVLSVLCLKLAACDRGGSANGGQQPPAAAPAKNDQPAAPTPSAKPPSPSAQPASAPSKKEGDPAGDSAKAKPGKVTVYCSVDEEIAKPIFAKYMAQTKADVQVIYDTEAGKTTGLVNRIVEESKSGRPRCDVLWSSEVFNTIRLARQGLLEKYESPYAEDIPEKYKDAEHRWHGSAVRARVLAYDPARVANEDKPLRWADVVGETSRSIAIANPLFGTTRGHIAAMFALWGKDKAREYLIRLRDGGAEIVAGNSAAVRLVVTGKVDFAFTDSDDCQVARARGMANIDFVYPTMGDTGTLLIPCTAAIIKGTSNLTDAQKLVDYLISADVELALWEGPAVHWPVRRNILDIMEIFFPAETSLTFDQIVDAMDESDAAVREILLK